MLRCSLPADDYRSQSRNKFLLSLKTMGFMRLAFIYIFCQQFCAGLQCTQVAPQWFGIIRYKLRKERCADVSRLYEYEKGTVSMTSDAPSKLPIEVINSAGPETFYANVNSSLPERPKKPWERRNGNGNGEE